MRHTTSVSSMGVVALWLLLFSPHEFSPHESARGAEDNDLYLRDVKPLLQLRCISCHGALKQEAGLRLDTGEFARRGGESGAAVVPGDLESSFLLDRVGSDDESERMPPEGAALEEQQIAKLRQWIEAGARSPNDEQPERDPSTHWSFRRPRKSPLPEVGPTWGGHPIDAFIRQQQQRRGVEPLGRARPEILLRRVYLDLIGLPPTRQQLQNFLQDPTPEAYARVVDELLASQHYGERWGRHWMDVWRYSDWYGRRQVGDVRNSYPHIWRWRDWIVNSLNDDKGYDQMIREMIAADELHPGDDDRAAALGFIVRNWFSLNYDTWKQDLVEHTGKAFLALRFNCAHCHDHKYDPIAQEDYFRLRAFFEPLELRHDRVPEGGPLAKYLRYTPSSGGSLKPIAAGLPRVYDLTMDEKTHMYRLGDTRDRLDRPPVTAGVPPILSEQPISIEAIQLPPVAWYPGLRPFVGKEELAKHETAIATAATAFAKATEAAAPGREKLAQAERELAAVETALAASQQEKPAQSFASRDADRAIAWWRFEGTDDSRFLTDSSGNEFTLVRVNGGDSPSVPVSLSAGSTTRAFLPTLSNGLLENKRAAEFQQDRSFAYLATAPPTDSSHADEKVGGLYANQFSLEAFVHCDVSAKNYNRTIADLDGCWTLLHRGLDATTFELRVRYFNEHGQLRDVTTGEASPTGSRPLVLHTGHDYYLCLVVAAERVSIWAADLTARTPLALYDFPRNMGDQEFDRLQSPAKSTPFKIGNSDGTGRFDGLIDEVRYTRELLSEEQVAAVVGQPASPAVRAAADKVTRTRHELKQTELAVQLCEKQLAQAKVERAWTQSRLAADLARYSSDELNSTSAIEKTRVAVEAELQMKIARQETNLVAAENNLASLSNEPKKNAAGLATAEKARAKAQSALSTLRQQKPASDVSYTPFGPTYPKTSSGRRRALALWLSNDDNPLPARVAVNHIWLRHFGRPLVQSVFDFGRSGEGPTHPELLDWLAVELMENNWSMKHVHRLIVTSQTYQLSSRPSIRHQKNLTLDKDNATWWKADRRRLESEVIRDSMLFVAGQLDTTLGGPEVDVKNELTSRRRSMYFAIYPEAGGMMPFMTVFDPPDPADCYRRSESIVPQQALAMVNSELGVSQGRLLARRFHGDDVSDETFVTVLFEATLSRTPNAVELKTCLAFLAKQRALYEATAVGELNSKAGNGVQPASSEANLRARESLARTLLNHNDFVTVH